MESFQRDQVGQDRANSIKPLQRAKVRVTAAKVTLATAQAKHAQWLAVEAQALEARRKADEEERKLRVRYALRARKEAESWRVKVERARALAAAHPNQPALLSDDEALASDVAEALSLWRSRPEVRLLTGQSAMAIRAEIEALPLMPSGDRVPRAGVVAAKKAYDRAVQAFELHEVHRPSDVTVTDTKGFTGDQLRELARTLETTVPPVDSGLEAAYRESQRQLDGIRSSWASRPMIVGLAVAGVLGGVGVWATWNPWIGGVLVLLGVAAFVGLVFRSGDAGRARLLVNLREVEGQVLSQRRAAEDAAEKMNTARAQVVERGLPLDGRALRELADGLVLAEQRHRAAADWSQRHEERWSDVTAARETFGQALRDAQVVVTTDLAAAFEEYERACQSREAEASRAANRQALDQQLLDRQTAEQAVRDAEERRAGAEQKVLAVLALCGLEASGPEAASNYLSRWQIERTATLVTFDEATREFAELNALLDGGTLEDLETKTSDYQRQAEELAVEFSPIPEIALGENLIERVQEAERLAHDAAHAATEAETQARDRAREAPSVPEAEEALTTAQQELDRVMRLGGTLTLTLDFLRRAEERVHRDIAPLLAAGLRRWLSDVTQGRYTDARVDPSDLSVQVLGADNEWRDARRLSHGTAEQIYLLLRVVLAERLATTGETCPLILDDVLVQSDRSRKLALLDVMLSISRARQVVLFTQEDEVLKWAQEHVLAPNAVVVLASTQFEQAAIASL
jgi:hypothetical protein